jgi:hypothetical protein
MHACLENLSALPATVGAALIASPRPIAPGRKIASQDRSHVRVGLLSQRTVH